MNAHTQSKGSSIKFELIRSRLNERSEQTFFAREGIDPLTHAFEKKVTIHAGFDGQSISLSDRDKVLNNLLKKPRRKKTAVYLHVPFCESHCLYCGFFNRFYKKNESARFTDALMQETDIWCEQPAVRHGPVHAVYIGGGTPTALESSDLKRLLTHVKTTFPLTNDCEITVEGRIHNFSTEKMEACLIGGANRFSIGVQTFHTDLRRSMKRKADRETVLKSLATLRDIGRAAVIIDLIYGFPGQTMDMWRRDIEDLHALNLDGADLYQLNIFPKSPLARAIDQGLLKAGADLPQQALMFAEGVQRMDLERYRRLSVSHWGRTTRERNIYNHLMKGPSECLAYGPGAGGCLNDHFYFLESDYKKWITSVKTNKKPLSFLTAPHPLAAVNKTIAAAFDLGRIHLGRIGTNVGKPIEQILSPLTDQWQRAGLITVEDNWLELTVAGQFWHVNLAQLMINFLHQNIAKEQT